MPLAAVPCHERLRRHTQCGPQGLRYVAVRLEAARPDGRSDGGAEVRRVAAVILGHDAYRLRGDAGGGAPPTGVGCADDPAHRVVEQQYIAVGGEHDQGDARHVRHQGVGAVVVLRLPQAFAAVHRRDAAHIAAVHLTAEYRPLHIRVQRGAQAAEVLLYVGKVIAPAVIQVQTVPGGGGDTALSGGKAVDDGAVFQHIRGQIDQIVFCVDVEHSVSFRRGTGRRGRRPLH